MSGACQSRLIAHAGGGDFYMASKYGVFVHGVDLSVNMVTTALERASVTLSGAKARPVRQAQQCPVPHRSPWNLQ